MWLCCNLSVCTNRAHMKVWYSSCFSTLPCRQLHLWTTYNNIYFNSLNTAVFIWVILCFIRAIYRFSGVCSMFNGNINLNFSGERKCYRCWEVWTKDYERFKCTDQMVNWSGGQNIQYQMGCRWDGLSGVFLPLNSDFFVQLNTNICVAGVSAGALIVFKDWQLIAWRLAKGKSEPKPHFRSLGNFMKS